MSQSLVNASLPRQTVTITVSIPVRDLPHSAIVPDRDPEGRTQAQPDVNLIIPYGKASLAARVKGRSFRRLMRHISQSPKPPEKVLLVGRLSETGDIEAAGFNISNSANMTNDNDHQADVA